MSNSISPLFSQRSKQGELIKKLCCLATPEAAHKLSRPWQTIFWKPEGGGRSIHVDLSKQQIYFREVSSKQAVAQGSHWYDHSSTSLFFHRWSSRYIYVIYQPLVVHIATRTCYWYLFTDSKVLLRSTRGLGKRPCNNHHFLHHYPSLHVIKIIHHCIPHMGPHMYKLVRIPGHQLNHYEVMNVIPWHQLIDGYKIISQLVTDKLR